MNRAAPAQWHGYRVDGAGDQSVLVECIPQWIRGAIGFSAIPQTDRAWGIIVRKREIGGAVEAHESALYYLKHGVLWLDNSAEFAQWRTALAYYPEQVWYARLAEECFRLWQHGEYNFVQRVAKRGDPLATRLCLGKFAEGVMRMSLLLQKDYTPYWKWLTYTFRKLDRAERYAPMLEALLGSTEAEEQVKLVTKLCHDLYQDLLATGVITGQGVGEFAKYLLPLLNAHNELIAKATWLDTIAE